MNHSKFAIIIMCKMEENMQDIKQINHIERMKMIECLINKDCYYECMLLSRIFIENSENIKEKELCSDIINICRSTQKKDKNKILQMIKEL